MISMSDLRIDPAVDVHDVVVGEHPHHLTDGVALADVGQELVAQPRPFGRSFDDAGDVDERHRRRHELLRTEDLGELAQPRIRQRHHTLVRLDRRERIVGRQHVVTRQRVEQRRLSDVGQSDDSQVEAHGIHSLGDVIGTPPIARGVRSPQPVRSTCVRTARAAVDTGRPPLCASQFSGSPLVGCGPHRRRRMCGRFRVRRRFRWQGAHRSLLRALRHRLRGGRARGTAGCGVHRGHPAAADAVRRRTRRLLPDARRRHPRHQGRPHQLRLSVDRAVPADVLHLGDGAADRPGPLVLRQIRPRAPRPQRKRG